MLRKKPQVSQIKVQTTITYFLLISQRFQILACLASRIFWRKTANLVAAGIAYMPSLETEKKTFIFLEHEKHQWSTGKNKKRQIASR